MPRDAVMDRKMLKAEINTNTLLNNVDALVSLFILLVLFPSCAVKFAIVLGSQKFFRFFSATQSNFSFFPMA